VKAFILYARLQFSTCSDTLLAEVGPSCRQIPLLTQSLSKTGCTHDAALVRGRASSDEKTAQMLV